MRNSKALLTHFSYLFQLVVDRGVVAPDRFQSMGQIEINWVLMLNWIVEIELFLFAKLSILANLTML